MVGPFFCASFRMESAGFESIEYWVEWVVGTILSAFRMVERRWAMISVVRPTITLLLQHTQQHAVKSSQIM
jgi:hypothetical protein